MPSSEDRCPGVLHALQCRDGLLVRVRVPGGMLSPEQLLAAAEIAHTWGAGFLDITARANLQLRGIRENTLEHTAQALAQAALLPSLSHDRVRNIYANPFAGFDEHELLDVRPLVREVDAGLSADSRLAALPAKFCFAFDGGGHAFDTAGTDLALCAVQTEQGLRLQLTLGGTPTGLGVFPHDGAQTMLRAAEAALAYAHAHDLAAQHVWRLRRLPEAAQHIRAALTSLLRPCPRPRGAEIPANPFGIRNSNAEPLINIIPLAPLGRLSAAQARGLAALTREHAGELRLAPWRGINLLGMPRAAWPEIRRTLEELALPPNTAGGYAHITACAGITGCTKALADVRADAATIAHGVAADPALAATTFALAACEKRCAMPAQADVELIATPAGYTHRTAGAQLGLALSPQEAIAAALRAHSTPEPSST